MKVLGTNLDLVSKKVINVLDPTSAQDAATKAYVDSLFGGLDWKASVRAATTATITQTGTQTIDGVAVIAGDRVLCKDQSTASLNGIWVVAAGAWARATDADANAEVTAGMVVAVEEGTTNADKAFILTTNGAITVGSTGLTFAALPTGGSSGYATVQESGSGLTQRTILNFGTGVVATDNAGSTRTDVDIDTAVVVRKYSAAIGDGSTTAITVTHNLGTQDVTVGVYLASGTFEEVLCDITHPTTNTVVCTFAVAPTSGQYRVVVHG